MAHPTARYEPRQASHAALHRIVLDHLETFCAEAAQARDGRGLPQFVEQEFREFLGCGVLARGFARFRCDDCGLNRLVPFSCKGRGFCPSCGGRRMAERAAHLVDHVFPPVPVRQWTLSLPHRLRYLLAYDHALCRAVVGTYMRSVLGHLRREAVRAGVSGGRGGAVAVVQRFGAALNLNVHVHAMVIDGVFAPDGRGALSFHAAPPLSDADVGAVLGRVRLRVQRLLERRGLAESCEGAGLSDSLSDEAPVFAGITAASVVGTVALGAGAGTRIGRCGEPRDPGERPPPGRRHARLDGFDLHANVVAPAGNRERLERLCRYALRPPVAQERLSVTDEGDVLLMLRRPWTDGTTHLLFGPTEFLERLAALTPRPRVNLVLYYGVLGARAGWRARVVGEGFARESPAVTATNPTVAARDDAGAGGVAGHADHSAGDSEQREWRSPTASTKATTSVAGGRLWRADRSWADLMRRAFAFDVLACDRCGGRLRLLATIEQSDVIHRILGHLGLPTELPTPKPPRAPPEDRSRLWERQNQGTGAANGSETHATEWEPPVYQR